MTMELQALPSGADSYTRREHSSTSESSDAAERSSSGATLAAANSSSSEGAAASQAAMTEQDSRPKAGNGNSQTTATELTGVAQTAGRTQNTVNAHVPAATEVIEVTELSQETSLDTEEEERRRIADRIVEIDGARVMGLSEDDEAFYRAFTEEERLKVRRKIDCRLLPMLCILYLFAQLDRSNIANAKIEGLKEDTKMTDEQYNFVLAVFFIPYFLLGTFTPRPNGGIYIYMYI